MDNKQIREELKNLLHLLKQEKNEDLAQYRSKMAGTSLVERRRQGVCWYPVQLERTQFDTGERLLVKVSRPIEHKESHLFQSGKLVSLFSNAGANVEEDETVSAVVNYVREHEMMITLNSYDFPDWIHDGKLGIQLLFDENSYREMEKTMHYLIETEEERIKSLINILIGGQVAEFNEIDKIQIENLNQSQNEALNLVLSAKDLAIVHGPPGTGKTTTLVESILETLKQENQVLVCAPSNAAIDLIVEKLSEKGINVLRIGHPARVTEQILNTTMDARIAHHSNFKDLKFMRRQVDEYRKMGRKFKRNFGPNEREQRKLLLSEASKLKDEADQLAFYISRDILSKAQVIASTLVGANNSVLVGMRYKTVFIDEAAQALEPACWIPITKSDRIIFAGDHQQLPPTIKSQEAAKKGLEVTLFEKAIKRNKSDVMLREQYRMNSAIMNFSSRFFYNNLLIANEKVSDWKIFDDDLALEFIDTAGCGFFEQVDRETLSSFNPEEADLLLKHLSFYLSDLELINKLHEVQNIGIISPYKAQTTLIAETIEINKPFPIEMLEKIAVNTVDSFQGQERDIIYISLVRSNESGEIGFLSDTRRMNVAMTRARKKLVIIGDSGTIGKHQFYSQLLDYVNEINAYRSAYELLY
jgi:ATP-dependent RNA/DNA helicase IGHMBP2